MAFFHKQVHCPFCFSHFSVQDILFRCAALNCAGRVPDTVYAQARNAGAVPAGRILSPEKTLMGVPLMTECDVCRKETRTRICPHCHFELPHDTGQIDNRVIAIIGGSNTGKSHYIAALIHRLQHEVGAHFQLGVSMLGDDTRNRWMNDFYRPIFENRTILRPTLRTGVDWQVKSPLTFRLTLQKGLQTRAFNLSFFDTAGEDMTSLAVDTLSIEARYISHAHGIIVLLDPLQLEGVRNQLPPSVNLPKPDYQANPEYMVGRLRELLEHRLNLNATQKVRIPIAFTLSKIDALRSIVEPGSSLLRSGNHSGFLNTLDVQSVNTEISSYLKVWIGSNFSRDIQLKFARYNFFGVSSLGKPPEANNSLSTIAPLRVEDPFLWLLYQFNHIRGRKGGR